MWRAPSTALLFALLSSAGVAACQGCQPQNGATSTSATALAAKAEPTLRLYVVSSVAGALEPCGCTKNQLGGIDHFAAFVESQKAAAPDSLLVGAGSLLFLEPTLKPDAATQDTWKAEAIALAAKRLGLVAWAPGANDFAAGSDVLAKLGGAAGATILAENVAGKAPLTTAPVIKEIGGFKVGFIGVSDPKDRAGHYPDELHPTSSLDAMKKGIAEAKAAGARILVGLAALPRGEALRLADAVPELNVLVVGKPIELGDANDGPKAPVLAGNTLVVETANHLQSVGVVDLYVRGDVKDKPIVFADAGGVAKAEALLSLSQRLRELELRITSWELDKNVKPADLAARRTDLEKLRAEKAKLEAERTTVDGSFFRVSFVEVREKLGADEKVKEEMGAYYKRVNEHNKVAFADRKPVEAEKGKASYIGVEACSACHEEPRTVWDATPHATAYPTLKKQFKEFNLDCVSCHVTGYGKAGGSTVTWNDKLQNVQCEECHGPGSLHAKNPKDKELIVRKPSAEGCVSACHHSPHVESFDVKEKMKLILGKGHGHD